MTVLTRWAIVMVDFYSAILFRVFWINFQFLLSRAEVASSSNNNFGFLRRALAMAILCFWPPDICPPDVPAKVSNFSFNQFTKSNASAFFKAAFIYYYVAYYLPKMRFYLKLAANKTGSCPTQPICDLSQFKSSYLKSFPSKVILPSSGSQNLIINWKIVDFPHPD